MEKESFSSGYGRGIDKSRMVVVITADAELVEVDCDYGCCPHAPNCTIAQKINDLITPA